MPAMLPFVSIGNPIEPDMPRLSTLFFVGS